MHSFYVYVYTGIVIILPYHDCLFLFLHYSLNGLVSEESNPNFKAQFENS